MADQQTTQNPGDQASTQDSQFTIQEVDLPTTPTGNLVIEEKEVPVDQSNQIPEVGEVSQIEPQQEDINKFDMNFDGARTQEVPTGEIQNETVPTPDLTIDFSTPIEDNTQPQTENTELPVIDFSNISETPISEPINSMDSATIPEIGQSMTTDFNQIPVENSPVNDDVSQINQEGNTTTGNSYTNGLDIPINFEESKDTSSQELPTDSEIPLPNYDLSSIDTQNPQNQDETTPTTENNLLQEQPVMMDFSLPTDSMSTESQNNLQTTAISNTTGESSEQTKEEMSVENTETPLPTGTENTQTEPMNTTPEQLPATETTPVTTEGGFDLNQLSSMKKEEPVSPISQQPVVSVPSHGSGMIVGLLASFFGVVVVGITGYYIYTIMYPLGSGASTHSSAPLTGDQLTGIENLSGVSIEMTGEILVDTGGEVTGVVITGTEITDNLDVINASETIPSDDTVNVDSTGTTSETPIDEEQTTTYIEDDGSATQVATQIESTKNISDEEKQKVQEILEKVGVVIGNAENLLVKAKEQKVQDAIRYTFIASKKAVDIKNKLTEYTYENIVDVEKQIDIIDKLLIKSQKLIDEKLQTELGSGTTSP